LPLDIGGELTPQFVVSSDEVEVFSFQTNILAGKSPYFFCFN